MFKITDTIAIDEKEIRLKFVRSSGPGGQNVNKVATGVQLRFDVLKSSSLPDKVRKRLLQLDKRITEDGILIVNAHRFRTQELNRKDAIFRLIESIRRAAERPKTRIKMRPSPGSKMRRLEGKRRRSMMKRLRTPVRLSREKY